MSEDGRIDEVLRALVFAADRHRDQRRKDADETPYINHPISVARTLTEAGIDDHVLILAAILHDSVEDTETTAEELEDEFGSEVASLVAEVTDDKDLPKQVRKDLQVEHAAGGSDRAKQLKIADKIANLLDLARRPPPGWSEARKLEYFDWADRVVAGCRGVNAALDRRYEEVREAGLRALEVGGSDANRARPPSGSAPEG